MVKKLSVITINLNNKYGLKKTIESVVNQTFKNFEFIVIDGGSTDGSCSLLEDYSNSIDYWISEPDTGMYNAMNKGVLAASGEYCNFMNSGDTFYDSNILEKVFNPGPMEDILIGKAKTPQRVILPPDNPSFIYFFTKKSINHQAAFIKRFLLMKFPYDEQNLRIVSDWKFFLDAIIVSNCTYKALGDFIVNFDDTGIGSLNIDFNIAEQTQVLQTSIYPRILEDYTRIRYMDSPFVKAGIFITRYFEKYGKFFNPLKYFRKIRKKLKKLSENR